MRAAGRFLLFLVLIPLGGAWAMRFDYFPSTVAGAPGLVAASGKVMPGDTDQLRAMLQALPPSTTLAGLSLNSPGGDLVEGMRLAAAVREAGLATIVGDGGLCASACFSVFAAGRRRFASSRAQIGVHSAAYRGSEEPAAEAATVEMARQLARFGVPDAILGSLVTAPPTQVSWLDRTALESLHADSALPQILVGPAVSLSGLGAPQASGTGAAQPTQSASPNGFKVEPSARGFAVLHPAGGFQVWRPGAAH